MYGIPSNLDLSKAVGESTSQICVGEYDIQFDLGEVHFAVQSPITLTKQNKVFANWEEGAWPESGFIEIFNVAVSKITIPNDKTIIVSFENGVEMYLQDNSDQFESMQITINGDNPKTWII